MSYSRCRGCVFKNSNAHPRLQQYSRHSPHSIHILSSPHSLLDHFITLGTQSYLVSQLIEPLTAAQGYCSMYIRATSIVFKTMDAFFETVQCTFR